VFTSWAGRNPRLAPHRQPLRARPEFDDRRAVAVLPFANFSGDPEQEYFADGITEDIIALSRRLASLPSHRPQLDLHLQRKDCRYKEGRRGVGVRYVPRGERAQVRQSGSESLRS